MKFSFLFLWFFSVSALGEIRSLNFDFDDNLLVTDAKVHPYNQQKSLEATLSTAEWAVTHDMIGQLVPWKDFGIGDGTFREVSDKTPLGTLLFAEQIRKALDKKIGDWQGPAWKSFVRALGDKQTRRVTTIISARRHTRDSFQSGLRVLMDRGFLPALPDKENLFITGDPDFPAQYRAPTIPKMKTNVMLALLDQTDAVDNEGGKKEKLHLWGFSDDDYGNFFTAEQALSKEFALKRWPHTKVVLAFTGLNHPTERPRCDVLKFDGYTRPCTPAEEADTFKAP